ncbi:MAG TPA: hypothetical protein VF177_17440 [Anaerolineae bacterium]
MKNMSRESVVRGLLVLLILLSGVALIPYVDLPHTAFSWRLFAGLYQPISVAIDIVPGSDTNPINPWSEEVIPVAILTTAEFDATTVDPLSVRFGPNGAREDDGQAQVEDVDGDGSLDLLLHFHTQDTGIECGDTVAYLTGRTFRGQAIVGSDSITTVGCAYP